MSKMGSGAKDIIFDPDGYEVTDNGIVSDNVIIDSKNGIIKIGDLGIDTSKCDVVDWDAGVFKSYDGSIDIDLLNNKYIDTESGIFVDPDYGVSAVLDGEHFENIGIPSFGRLPWDSQKWNPVTGPDEPNFVQDGILKTTIYNLGKLFGSDADSIADSDLKDIFGNDIVQTTDASGDAYLTSVPKVDDSIFAKVANIVGGDENAINMLNNAKLSAYMDANHPSFGTRVMVYEGGRHSWGGDIPESYEKYDINQANEVLEKVALDGSYYPDPGSKEALNFAIFQNEMIKGGFWDAPIISPNLILDIDGDEKPDIDLDGDGKPDYDIDGDGIIDFSSQGGILHNMFDSLKNLWPF